MLRALRRLAARGAIFCASSGPPRPSPPPTPAARRLEKALRRFRKGVNMSGHLRVLRNRKQFESNHDKQIRKDKESAMRRARARRGQRTN